MSVRNIYFILLCSFEISWPKDHHAIQIPEINRIYRSFDNVLRFLILHEAWRNLARDEKVSTGESPHELVILKLNAENLVVLIEASCIEMLVAGLKGSLDGGSSLLLIVVSEMVAPESNLGNISSVVKRKFFRKEFTKA